MPNSTVVAATPLRKLKAKAVMKDLSLKEISKRAGVPYAQASQVLNGKLIHEGYFAKIEKAIQEAPEPK